MTTLSQLSPNDYAYLLVGAAAVFVGYRYGGDTEATRAAAAAVGGLLAYWLYSHSLLDAFLPVGGGRVLLNRY